MKRPRKQSEWKKVMRTEAFSVYQNRSQAHRFRINWNDHDGVRRRYKLWADSIEEAGNKARNVIAGRDPDQPAQQEQAADGPQGLLVVEAFEGALEQAKRGKRSRQSWENVQTTFIGWLAVNHPECTHWSLINRQIIREYMAPMAGKAPNTIRLAMQPILQVAGFMEAEYDLPNPTRRLRIGNQLKNPTARVYLADVLDLLDWLREHEPRLEAGAALQGLCGLQLQEATRLTWNRVDLKRGLVEISGEVKNPYRERVIPVPQRALEALHRAERLRAAAKQKVVSLHDGVLLSAKGCAYDGESWFNFSKDLSAAIKTWNPAIRLAPKDLRNCIMQLAERLGFAGATLEQYVGHAARGVTARHYLARLASVSSGEADALEEAMEIFRERVIRTIDREIEKLARKGHDKAGVQSKSAVPISGNR